MFGWVLSDAYAAGLSLAAPLAAAFVSLATASFVWLNRSHDRRRVAAGRGVDKPENER